MWGRTTGLDRLLGWGASWVGWRQGPRQCPGLCSGARCRVERSEKDGCTLVFTLAKFPCLKITDQADYWCVPYQGNLGFLSLPQRQSPSLPIDQVTGCRTKLMLPVGFDLTQQICRLIGVTRLAYSSLKQWRISINRCNTVYIRVQDAKFANDSRKIRLIARLILGIFDNICK